MKKTSPKNQPHLSQTTVLVWQTKPKQTLRSTQNAFNTKCIQQVAMEF